MDKKISILDFMAMKERGEKITMLTAYDYPTARILDRCGVEALLIGDSVGNVVMGTDTTLPVTTDEIVYHTKAVVRGRTRALVVADLPFLSYQVSLEQAKREAGRLIKEGGAEAVKLEGGQISQAVIRFFVNSQLSFMVTDDKGLVLCRVPNSPCFVRCIHQNLSFSR